jgi:S-formylglutathione hydrolase
LALICPDTSPRGLNIAGEDDSWDFGTGAGFYVNAVKEPFGKYQMYSYINDELISLLPSLYVDKTRISISGHSMGYGLLTLGGHGALISAIKNPIYKSCSAFAPICN